MEEYYEHFFCGMTFGLIGVFRGHKMGTPARNGKATKFLMVHTKTRAETIHFYCETIQNYPLFFTIQLKLAKKIFPRIINTVPPVRPDSTKTSRFDVECRWCVYRELSFNI